MLMTSRALRHSTFLCRRSYSTTQPRLLKSDDFEYVYGHSSVLSALFAKKRHFDSVLLRDRSTNNKTDSSIIETIRQQCKALNIPIRTKDKGYLNNLTMNKPHQGVVLKASIRETIPITSLSIKDTSYIATPKNPAKNDIILQKLDSRAPLWIALDELQDPQNLGSILRTAHFFGVDGVLLCSKNSAPLSPAVSKVSSGAMEVMDIYSTSSLVRFLKSSSEQGWSIVGAAGHVANCESVANIAARVHSSSPSERTPTVLVLGNEGVGLRTNVKACCHHFVSIPGQVSTEFMGHVDSLNVGVAAGILIAGIMAPL